MKNNGTLNEYVALLALKCFTFLWSTSSFLNSFLRHLWTYFVSTLHFEFSLDRHDDLCKRYQTGCFRVDQFTDVIQICRRQTPAATVMLVLVMLTHIRLQSSFVRFLPDTIRQKICNGSPRTKAFSFSLLRWVEKFLRWLCNSTS